MKAIEKSEDEYPSATTPSSVNGAQIRTSRQATERKKENNMLDDVQDQKLHVAGEALNAQKRRNEVMR